jgi:hypothetical protein
MKRTGWSGVLAMAAIAAPLARQIPCNPERRPVRLRLEAIFPKLGEADA